MAPIPAVRKLTTILAADAVGYSRLMSANEEKTLQILRTYREVIDDRLSKHGGRIFNTAGDAFLAEFGSPVEAVRCAISIQEDLAVRNAQREEDEQMWFRIGINVGDVMVEGNDLFGDGVNVASRLEALAEMGGVCISGSTFEQVKNKLAVSFSDLGPQLVKNIPEPIPAFRVVPGRVSVSKADQEARPRHPASFRIITAALAIVAVSAAGTAWWHLSGNANSAFPFDGRWEVAVNSRSGCIRNEPISYSMLVVEGAIDEPTHRLPKKGTIASNGRFKITVSSRDGRTLSTQEGVIAGDRGEGQFIGARPGCTGKVKLTRLMH